MVDDDGPPTSSQLPPPEFRNEQTNLLTPPPLHPPASVAEKETSAPPSIGETLASPSVGSNRDGGYPSFSELLGGVISANRVCFQTFSQDHQTLRGPLRFEGKFEMSHLEALSTVTAEAVRDKKWMEPQAPSHKSPVTSSEVCQPSSTPVSQEPSFVPRKDAHMQEVDQLNCSNIQLQSKDSDIIMKSPAFDRFNWRKYGQKQVRSSESHRSYYRCSHSDCHAKKKVQHCDHSGCVIEVNYKGEHNHDPPQKIRCPRSRRYVSSTEASMGSDVVESPSQKLDGPGLSVPQTRAEHSPLSLPMPEMERMESQDSRNSNDILSIKMEEVVNNLEARNKPPLKMVPRKRKKFSNADIVTNFEGEEQCSDFDPRMKESPVKYSDPLFRSPKEPKIIVHAATDVEISSDGYRWRKYGQKKVKGNSYPRSYYRCASAGCPVRKHVERTLEEAAVIIITYEGKHDHDMPVPKQSHVPPILIEAAAMNNVQKRTESSLDLISPTGSPVDMESDLTGDKAFELAGERAL